MRKLTREHMGIEVDELRSGRAGAKPEPSPFTSCVTLSALYNLPVHQSPHLKSNDNTHTSQDFYIVPGL